MRRAPVDVVPPPKPERNPSALLHQLDFALLFEASLTLLPDCVFPSPIVLGEDLERASLDCKI